MKRQKLRTKFKANKSGFTIVEILLVVVLIALIGSVGGGICVGAYKKMLVKKAARDFVLAAKYARILAIERQRPCKIEMDKARKRFALIVEELDEQTGQSEQMTVRDIYFKSVEFGGDVKFEDIQIEPIGLEEFYETDEEGIIVFSPNGTSRSVIVQIGDGRNHYAISVSASTGKVKMHTGTAEDVEVDTVDLDKE